MVEVSVSQHHQIFCCRCYTSSSPH